MKIISLCAIAALLLCMPAAARDATQPAPRLSLLKPQVPISLPDRIVKAGECSVVCGLSPDQRRFRKVCVDNQKCECWCGPKGEPECSPCK